MGIEKNKHGNTSHTSPARKTAQEEEQELMKAVAQAWHAQSGIQGTTKEFDAQKSSRFKQRPSRFRVEAMNMAASKDDQAGSQYWDFAQSLWDSYEIVTLSKKLEASLSVDDPVLALSDHQSGGRTSLKRRRMESRNSLRHLLQRITSSSSSSSSKRFDAAFDPIFPAE